MKIVYLVCFDIANARVRTQVGKVLLKYGNRVQKSVFEVMFSSSYELKEVQKRLRIILKGETELRFYRLCLECRKKSNRIDDEGLAAFPAIWVM